MNDITDEMKKQAAPAFGAGQSLIAQSARQTRSNMRESAGAVQFEQHTEIAAEDFHAVILLVRHSIQSRRQFQDRVDARAG
ncbi:hypothetical protein WI73_15910 [Burkholderia ubonensis]|uniref:hypothetical protein n=1 Tax=Burkholderia ubonensis TaxID=101571 RepID=UPI000756469B|nr:hypothetical protein [Burkholderia ubonensis]KVC69392.1 hypothetical protein WI73_15910 [Burkholderia ubonensis]